MTNPCRPPSLSRDLRNGYTTERYGNLTTIAAIPADLPASPGAFRILQPETNRTVLIYAYYYVKERNQKHPETGPGTDHLPGAGSGFFFIFQTPHFLYRLSRTGHAAVLYAGSGRLPAAARAGKSRRRPVLPLPYHPARGGGADLADNR